jgi:hypothetical protein
MMPERKVSKDYEEVDVRDVFVNARPTGWHDLINWLNNHGQSSKLITPGEAAHMIADAKQAAKDNVPFPSVAEHAFRIMKSHRNLELVRQEEQIWLAKAVSGGAEQNENVY